MTKKDFIAIAAAFAAVKPGPYLSEALEMWESCVHSLAQHCSDSNPRFDFARFYAACGADRLANERTA